MTLTAHVRDGRIVLDDPVSLPEGAALHLRVLPSGEGAKEAAAANPEGHSETEPGGATLLDALADVVGQARDLPPNAASSIDDTLYGGRP